MPEQGFARNPAYELENERLYHKEAASQANVLDNARNLDPDFLVHESIDANQGAPVIDRQGNVLGGNGRTMSIRAAYDRFPAKAQNYRNAILAQADALGLDSGRISSIERPILVRRLERDMELSERQDLISALNDDFKKSKTRRASGKSRGDRLGEKTLKALGRALADADSLRSLMDEPESSGIVEMLIRDGVFQETERNEFVTNEGLLNPDGKRVLEEALRGRVVRDYETLAGLPESIVAKIDAAIPHVLIAESVGGEWNITEHVRDAINLLGEYERFRKGKSADDASIAIFFDQVDMLSGNSVSDRYSQKAQSLFLKMLDLKKKDFAQDFGRFASQAALNEGGLGVGKSAKEAGEEFLGFRHDLQSLSRTDLLNLLPEDARQKTTGVPTEKIRRMLEEQQKQAAMEGKAENAEANSAKPRTGKAESTEKAQEQSAETDSVAQARNEDTGNDDSYASIQPAEFLAPGNSKARGLTAQKLGSIVERLNSLARNASGVEAVQKFQDLPAHLQKKFAAHAGSLEGVYDPATGKVWFVADNLESPRRAAEVWCHEQIVHNGLRGLFSEAERKQILNQLWLALGGMGNRVVRQVSEAYGLNPRGNMQDRLLAMEEALANMAERSQAGLLNKQEESLWQKIVRIVGNAINQIIERLTGQKSRIGMEEVDRLLSALGQYVMGGKQQEQGQGGEAAASLAAKGEVNSYGVPMERVTEIEGNITSEELNAALQELAGQDLENVLEGLTAQVNGNQRRKLESQNARQQSVDNGFSNAEHRVAVSKIANIWKWAAEAKGVGGRKLDNPETTIRRFVSALNVNGRDSFAWLTTKDTQNGLRIYSAELLTKKELQEKFDGVVADKALTGAASRSFDETLARLAGPVKSESDSATPLASLKLSDLLNLSGKKTAELAHAPEIAGSFNSDDLKWYQHFFALPHWISKTQGNFARIYERQIRRRDERSAKVMQSIAEIPSLFGKGSFDKNSEDMKSLNRLVWEIEGKQLPFEKKGKVQKYESDGKFENGRVKIKPNSEFYEEYEKALSGMNATPAAKKAMLEIRRSLDQDLANAYNRLAEMDEADDDAITKLRNNIGNVPNYFPHHRYGKYYVQAINTEGEVVYREHFDALTKADAAKKAKEIAAREQGNCQGAKWKQGINSKLPDEVLGAPIDPEAMEQIIRAATGKIADREQAKQITDMLCAATADVLKTRGWAEHAIGRKGVPGHETEDLIRVLYDYKNGLYGWLTKMDAARDFSRALGEIDAKKQPRLYGYASRYIEDMLRNYDSIDRMTGNIKAVAFAWYLGGNIKTATVNATQNIIVGVPRLQMDVTGGGRLWLKAAMDSIVNRVTGNTGKNLTENEARLIKELYEESVITDAFMSEVRGHMEGASFSGGWNRFTRILGLPMSEVERFNRASLALAAFRAAMAGKLKKAAMEKYGINGKATYEQAKAFVTEIVNDSHFVYGKSNLPEMLRGNATGRAMGSLYTFRTFSHNMINMWLWAYKNQGREGAQFIAKSLGATIALGGLTAFPFYATLAALCQMMSGDDDEDWTAKIRKYMPENNVMRDVVCYGVPAIGGINLGGSLQMETPFTRGMQKAEDADSFVSMLGEGIIGIPYDLARKGVKTLESAGNGEYFQALKEAVPTFVRNGMDAYALYFEGQHTKRGKPITRPGETEPVKLTGYEAIAKTLGFQPVSSTKRYAAYAAGKRADEVRSNAIERVVRKFMEARKTGDPKFAAEGRAEMNRWNEEKKAEGKEYLMFRMKDVMSRVNRRKATKPNARNRAQGERQMAMWGV